MSAKGEILDINGPMVTVRLPGVANGEQVRVGNLGLIGEVIGRDGEDALVQVYEATDSVCPGEPTQALGHPLSVELGPGLLGQIFDGVQRPLEGFRKGGGWTTVRGAQLDPLDRARRWSFEPADLKAGDTLQGGTILGTVEETGSVVHRILVPPDVSGELVEIVDAGEYTLDDPIARLRQPDGRTRELRLSHRWPVRVARPHKGRSPSGEPLLTGQRILDTFFPVRKGGKAAIPGPFGAGKTVVQQQIARWANTRIVIYVGCGERGNELVDILESFPELTDPHSGRTLMERTLIIANTSNMPVVAREASIYVGITIGEYFRDQGHDVVVVADSTSRWAEALREVAGRLGEIPVEEGYPAYLASRLAAFYERAGLCTTLADGRGSVTLIGAVSPPGGDFSEPVTSHTKDIVETFWALSKDLADARHYPSVDWSDSFSSHVDAVAGWWHANVGEGWKADREDALQVLFKAEGYTRIANLVGPEALSPEQRWGLQSAELLREGVLQQNALDPLDTFCSPERQYLLLNLMMTIDRLGKDLIAKEAPVQQLLDMQILGDARRWKSKYANDALEDLEAKRGEIEQAFDRVREACGIAADRQSRRGAADA